MKQKRILIVDDSQFDRTLMVKAIGSITDYQIIEASDAETAENSIEKQAVDLVLLDILMPKTNGIDFLNTIRKKYNPLELPIIMVTVKSETEDIVQCLKAGANDYITKPINFEITSTRVNTHLRISELSREMAKLKQVMTANAMITTYNHEINGPLATAIGCIESGRLEDKSVLHKLQTSIWKVADIVKKIETVGTAGELTFEDYSTKSKILKLK
jgi:DNA-binding response OmpR family regulator